MIDGFEPRAESITYAGDKAQRDVGFDYANSGMKVEGFADSGLARVLASPDRAAKAPQSPLDDIAARIASATMELHAIHSSLTNALDSLDGGQPQDDYCTEIAPEPCGFIGIAHDRLNNVFALIRRIHDQADRLRAIT